MYHSRFKGKEALKNWIGGMWKFLCATGALSAGINIKNLPLVLHCREPWGLSDFVQESGRGGRNGEDITSVLFISEEDYMKSKSKETIGLHPEVEGIREYVVTNLCRRLVITGYMDGKAQTCQVNIMR